MDLYSLSSTIKYFKTKQKKPLAFFFSSPFINKSMVQGKVSSAYNKRWWWTCPFAEGMKGANPQNSFALSLQLFSSLYVEEDPFWFLLHEECSQN